MGTISHSRRPTPRGRGMFPAGSQTRPPASRPGCATPPDDDQCRGRVQDEQDEGQHRCRALANVRSRLGGDAVQIVRGAVRVLVVPMHGGRVVDDLGRAVATHERAPRRNEKTTSTTAMIAAKQPRSHEGTDRMGTIVCECVRQVEPALAARSTGRPDDRARASSLRRAARRRDGQLLSCSRTSISANPRSSRLRRFPRRSTSGTVLFVSPASEESTWASHTSGWREQTV